MDIPLILLILLISFMVGSISFARIITKIFAGEDVTDFVIPVKGTDESYNVISIGANSVSSVLGPKMGMLVSLLDILKVLIPVLICKLLFANQPIYPIAAAIGGLVGHIWPIYYRFHGGSGFSAIIAGLLVIDPVSILITTIIGIVLGILVFRNMIVATLSWLWLLIPWFWWRFDGQPIYVIYAVLLNILFVMAMIPEIKTGLKFQREGRKAEYGISSLSSHPMGRGFLKMARAVGFMKENENKEP
jgi:acyl phosphate:glycerol-3-phosphate acyltransferase